MVRGGRGWADLRRSGCSRPATGVDVVARDLPRGDVRGRRRFLVPLPRSRRNGSPRGPRRPTPSSTRSPTPIRTPGCAWSPGRRSSRDRRASSGGPGRGPRSSGPATSPPVGRRAGGSRPRSPTPASTWRGWSDGSRRAAEARSPWLNLGGLPGAGWSSTAPGWARVWAPTARWCRSAARWSASSSSGLDHWWLDESRRRTSSRGSTTSWWAVCRCRGGVEPVPVVGPHRGHPAPRCPAGACGRRGDGHPAQGGPAAGAPRRPARARRRRRALLRPRGAGVTLSWGVADGSSRSSSASGVPTVRPHRRAGQSLVTSTTAAGSIAP